MTRTRRDILRDAALLTGVLALPAGAQPTPQSGELGAYGAYVVTPAPPKSTAKRQEWALTEDNILGPFHRKGAPYRAKVTPPLCPGKTLLVRGRVWSFASRAPIAGAVVDVWQANHVGRYDNDDSAHPPLADVFTYRARMLTDEQGRYEYETIHPGPYAIGPKQWRPSHIHYWVSAAGHAPLVTQLYFRGDKFNDADQFIKSSLIIDLAERKSEGGTYGAGTFDIVLAKS